jgi:hypothetical protein
MPRFNLAEHARKKKELNDQLIRNSQTILAIEQDIRHFESVLQTKRKEFNSKRNSCVVIDKKVSVD